MENPNSLYGKLAKQLPSVTGKTFIVVPSGSAIIPTLNELFPVDNDGVARVYTDPAAALAACVTDRGDAVGFLPGSYTISTVLSLSANNVKILGLGQKGSARLVGSAASILTLTGDDCEVAGLGFAIASTKKAITLTGADRTNIHDNVFTSAVGGAASHFIHFLTTTSDYCTIADNRFVTNLDVSAAGVTQTSHITLLSVGTTIERNVFVAGRLTTANAGAVTDAILVNDAASCGNTVRHNSFYEFNGATFTAGVESGASAVSGAIFPTRNDFLLGTAANAIVNTTGSAGFGNNVANGTV